MSAQLPRVSIIIAARPAQEEILSLSAAIQQEYPRDRIEILLARGSQPSAQRNAAAQQANGDLLAFLDDDSQPPNHWLRKAVAHFKEPAVQMVGGPNLCPQDAPAGEQAFAAVMGNPLAFGPSAARYRQLGEARDTTEKELILCNLVLRRATFLDLGGFNELLYPNEENALMDQVRAQGGRLIYDPDLALFRRPRRTLGAYGKMVLTYGRGRAEQFRQHPSRGSALNFAPPLLILFAGISWWLPWPCLLFWIGYGGVLAMAGFRQSPDHERVPPLWLAFLIALTHFGYGVGFWRGLLTRFTPPRAGAQATVHIERILPP